MRYFIFIYIAVLLAPFSLRAQIVITEVMYDVEGTDTGREWIEVHNDGQEAVDLSSWKLFEANTNHKFTAPGSLVVSTGGFAIIADVSDKFQADHAGFQGLILDSAFSLNNAGETISIRDPSGSDSDSLSYLPAWGAVGDGLSLQKTSDGRWIAAMPTPGGATTAMESETIADDDTSSDTSENASSTATTSNSNTEPIIYASYSSQSLANTGPDASSDLEVTSGRSRLGFVGVPLEFRAKIKKIKDASQDIDHIWSMGDGTSKYGSFISHTYRFSGDYTVVLNSRIKEIDAVSRTKVKIIDPAISISAANSDYIEIFNASEYELNLGGMILRTARERKIISDDTVIGPRSSVRLPSSSTKLGTMNDFVAIDSPLGNNFATMSVSDYLILLPQGMSSEDIRARLINALKTYE